jgi:predicted 3-demethylubiquinone-9 3-methyltransferase (glyoxalase superfamily)
MQSITPCLWFDRQAEEAMNFYVSVFQGSPLKEAQDSEIKTIKRYPDDMQLGPAEDMAGKVITGIFHLAGQRFMALDGGPFFKFSEAISFAIECESQEEIDYLWESLSAVPEAEQCGWLKDRFGVSWQIFPKLLGELMSDPDPEKAGRVTQAMLQMKKIDIPSLQRAYAME